MHVDRKRDLVGKDPESVTRGLQNTNGGETLSSTNKASRGKGVRGEGKVWAVQGEKTVHKASGGSLGWRGGDGPRGVGLGFLRLLEAEGWGGETWGRG